MSSEGNTQTLEADSIEALRRLLEDQQCRSISHEEALDVGETLLDFFELLADETDDRVNAYEPAI